jgi:hypothetical protein
MSMNKNISIQTNNIQIIHMLSMQCLFMLVGLMEDIILLILMMEKIGTNLMITKLLK